MCLISKTNIPKVSNTSIECYKVLREDNLSSPFYKYKFSLGVIETDDAIEHVSSEMFGIYMIESGFFHSFTDLQAAIKKCEECENIYKAEFTVYKVEIPSNTEYFIGEMGDICSKSLKIIKECD